MVISNNIMQVDKRGRIKRLNLLWKGKKSLKIFKVNAKTCINKNKPCNCSGDEQYVESAHDLRTVGKEL